MPHNSDKVGHERDAGYVEKLSIQEMFASKPLIHNHHVGHQVNLE